MTIAGVELMKTGAKPRRIDLLCIAGPPRGRRGETEEGEPHAPLCPPLLFLYIIIPLAYLPCVLLRRRQKCPLEIFELLRGYIHAP